MKNYFVILICIFGTVQAHESEHCDHARLKTVEITSKKNLKTVRAVLANWNVLSMARMYLALFSSQFNDSQKESASASDAILATMGESLDENVEIHVALDEQDQIQAIAFTQLKVGCKYLALLATNPENISIIGYEKPLRGAGTALIAHISNTLLQGQGGCKKLHLTPLPSAIGFYKKLGFVEDPRHLGSLILSRTSMRELLAATADRVTILKKEPKLPKVINKLEELKQKS
ncbi:MAG: GNAT family N-acetyltransferase [Verrucomicrobia bacterium]|nr:GNAT family N-acetyltransferase [Verrucomicrobiota bacterium]MBS0637036.1 GNAT family N-acetyltransferase [Verrucomicrobiota bacterium]